MKTIVCDDSGLPNALGSTQCESTSRANEHRVGSIAERDENDRSIMQWGGLAGMLGALFFILMAATLLGMTPEAAGPEGPVQGFPANRTVIALGEGFYLVVVILLAVLFLALYRALRKMSAPPALFGGCLGIMGVATLVVGALPYVAFTTISDLYHAPGATPEAQASLVLMWQSIQGVFNETDTVGFILMATGFIVLGVAMLRSPVFGRNFGGLSVILGTVVVIGMSVFGVSSDSVFPFVLIAFFFLPLLFGWKLYRVSKATPLALDAARG